MADKSLIYRKKYINQSTTIALIVVDFCNLYGLYYAVEALDVFVTYKCIICTLF